jgi:hypothetical protein
VDGDWVSSGSFRRYIALGSYAAAHATHGCGSAVGSTGRTAAAAPAWIAEMDGPQHGWAGALLDSVAMGRAPSDSTSILLGRGNGRTDRMAYSRGI